MNLVAATPGRVLQAALEYAARGWAVFPGHTMDQPGQCTCGKHRCGSPAKHPRIKAWPKEASTNLTVIRDWWSRWPDANVCIATGAISGIVVLDADPRHGGRESLTVIERQHGPLPETLTAFTGGGGYHFYFFHPGERVPNKVGLLPGIDLRGDGGFVVAPPSLHASGKEYSWI